MYGSYAAHSASVCFNGGVKVKRQPWNILSLTSLQLLLCNLHVIVWQKGEKTACQNMLLYNVKYKIRWNLFCIVMLEHHVLTPSCCAHRWNHNSLPTAGPSAACSPSPPTPASMLRSLTSLSPFPHSSTRRPWRYPVITPNDCMRAWVWQWLRGHSWDIPFQLKVNVNPPHSISLYNKGRRLWWTTVPFLFQIFFFLYDDYVRQTKWTGLLFWVDELSFAVWYER